MSKKRRLSIIALILIGLLYVATIVVGILGNMALTLTFLAASGVLSIIVFFVLKNIERNNNDANTLIEEGRKDNFPDEEDSSSSDQ